ncbi:MAG: SUMF1/EgtB/PvdO family nonheme iron enzyme [Candidatus Thiodiazotropha taylori]|nr:SUMF1/EgtB/PvdO family nonheme iron enzyme [Candidatus Thiodiazotropha taylori]
MKSGRTSRPGIWVNILILGLYSLFPMSMVMADNIPKVKQLLATESEGEVTLRYELVDPAGLGAEVLFEFSTDGGKRWIKPQGTRGDLGPGVQGGSRVINWDSYLTFPQGINKRLEFRVETRSERELMSTLTIEAVPADARIRILNIGPKYQPGIALKPGKYHLEVSKEGYKDKRQWIELSGGSEAFPIRLEKIPLRKSYEPEMLRIPGGSYWMGNQFGSGSSSEKPVHEVKISGFELGKYEVTQSQWKAVMGSNPSNIQDCPNCPVEGVSWDDIQDYIYKLGKMTGKYYRLPTEAEWEYACRSGGKQEKHCGGSNPDMLAWHVGNSDGKINQVGRKLPNGLGLYDMTGNVWEWVQDCWNDSYSGAPQDGSAWHEGDCSEAVLRGGSTAIFPGMSSFSRFSSVRNKRVNYSGGFRLAKDL